MAKVKVDITADGSGFHRVMGGIGSAVTGLKAKLAAAFSVGTIGYLSKQILDFGDSIQAMADNFDISTDAAQRFSWAARNANIQIGTLEKGMIGLDTAMRKALGGDTKTKGILSQLGISEKDLGSLTKENALLKVLQSSKDQGFSNNKTAGLLGQLGIQPRVANRIVGAKDDILNKSIPIVSESTIKRLDAVGDAMSNVKQIILQALIPAFLSLVKVLTNSVIPFLQRWANTSNFNAVMDSIAKGRGIERAGTLKTLDADLAYSHRLKQIEGGFVTGAMSANKGESPEAFAARQKQERAKAYNEYLTKIYGKDGPAIRNEAIPIYEKAKNDEGFLNNLVKILKDLETKLSPQPGDPDFIGPVQPKPEVGYTREPIKKAGEKFNQPGELQTSNEFLKIGGALGANIQYRMERIQLLQVEYMRRTADATEGILDKMGDGQDYSPQ